MSETEKKWTGDDNLARARKEIIPIFEQAIVDDEVIFRNPHIPDCWEMKNCEKTDCPTHAGASKRCWQIAGTYCGGRVQGNFVDKYSTCATCEVFKAACPTIVEELGEQLNNMLYLLRKQKSQAREHIERIEYLNRELATSIEDLDAKNQEIGELLIIDRLTGLYNRHYLFTVLEDELARSSRGSYKFSIVMLDVDNFKSFNDTYGHLKGDEMLAAMGGLLKGALRKADRAFRYGGEEFVVVLPDTDMTIAYLIAERIRASFREQRFVVQAGGGEEEIVSRTVSLGLATIAPGVDVYGLLARADEAMYRAKTMGKDMSFRYGEKEMARKNKQPTHLS